MDNQTIGQRSLTREEEYKRMWKSHVSDEQIEQNEQRILDTQLGEEEIIEWRANFLKQSGKEFSDDFVSRTALVRSHEPVIRESDDKDRQKMYDKVTKKYGKARKKRQKQVRTLQFARAVGGYVMPANQIWNVKQYDTVADAANMIYDEFKFKERSGEDLDALKSMYANLRIGCELEASYDNQIISYEMLLKDKEVLTKEDMREEVDRRLAVLRQRKELAGKWVSDLSRAIRQATNQDMSYTDEQLNRERDTRMVERFFGKRLGRQTEASPADVVAVQQRDYIKSFRGSEELRTEKEQSTVKERQETEEWVRSYYDDLNALSIEKYAVMGNRELMRNMRAIQEIGAIAGKMKTVGDRELAVQRTRNAHETILGDYCDAHGEDGMLMSLKLELAKRCSKKARLLWYMEAFRCDKLTADDILPEDRWFDETHKPETEDMFSGLSGEIAGCNAGLRMYLGLYNSRREQM